MAIFAKTKCVRIVIFVDEVCASCAAVGGSQFVRWVKAGARADVTVCVTSDCRASPEHRDTHEAAETFNCRYCKHVARTKIRLHRHMQEHHKDCMLPCPYCEKRFPEKCNLTRHVAIHLDPKFVCEVSSAPESAQDGGLEDPFCTKIVCRQERTWVMARLRKYAAQRVDVFEKKLRCRRPDSERLFG